MGGYAAVQPWDEDVERMLREGQGNGYAPVAPAPADISPAASSAPPVTSSSPMPAVMPTIGSTEDLESRAPQAQYAPAGSPNAEAERPRPAWKDYAPPEPHGWSKFGHVMAALNPATNEVFNALPERRAEQNYKNATAEYEAPIGERAKEAETEQKGSQGELQHEEAETLRRTGGVKQGQTPEEVTIHDLMTGENGKPRINPDTQQPYSYLDAYSKTMQAKQDTKPDPAVKDKEQDINDYLSANKLDNTPANREKARASIANRGKQEPGSYMPLYDEKGHVTGAWDPKTGDVQRTPSELPGNTAQGHTIGEKATAAATKEAQPYQQIVDIASQAHDLADMAAKGNASADVDLTLSFFKVMRGTGGANIRFTQQEQNLILGARNSGQDLLAVGQKVVGEGQPLTPAQRKHMVDVIDLHAKAAQQHLTGMQQGGGQGGSNQPSAKKWNAVTGRYE